MGSVTSLICTGTFCLERVLTWACCAFLLVMLMFTICLLVVYGISVGYHYAQKELAAYAQLFHRAMPHIEPEGPKVVTAVANNDEIEYVESTTEPELSLGEKQLARRLLRRFRRSRHNSTTHILPST